MRFVPGFLSKRIMQKSNMDLRPNIRDLFARINVIQGKFEERREQAFNVFSLCGVDHYELWHSKIIANFLSPKGSHGFKGEFLRAFAKLFELGEYSDNAIVRTEVAVHLDRFDILIEDEETGHVCIIENKIFAAEQPGQMARYKSWLDYERRQEGKNTHLVFLTLDGRKSSTLTNGYVSIAYSAPATGSGGESICAWIDHCAKIAKEVPFVRETLRQYCEHIKRLAMGESAMEHEIKLELERGMQAAEAVYRNYQAVCMDRATRILVEDVVIKLKEHSPKYEFLCENGLSLIRRESGVLYTPQGKPTDKDLKGQVWVIFDETGFTCCQIGLYQNLNEKSSCICDDEAFKTAIGNGFPESEGWRKINKDIANEWWPIWCPIFAGCRSEDCPRGICWDGKFFDDYRHDARFKEKVLSEIADKIIALYELQLRIAKTNEERCT